MAGATTILGICGSLRRESYNRALLRLAARVAPGGVDIVTILLHDVPLFDADVEAQGDPPPVVELKDRIRRADAVLIATPEYQRGVPGVLKNALDWASRPPDDSPIAGTPAAIMGATPGRFGTARAQTQLRQTLAYNRCPTVLGPEVLVASAADKVNDDGEFDDDQTSGFVEELIHELVALVEVHRS